MFPVNQTFPLNNNNNNIRNLPSNFSPSTLSQLFNGRNIPTQDHSSYRNNQSNSPTQNSPYMNSQPQLNSLNSHSNMLQQKQMDFNNLLGSLKSIQPNNNANYNFNSSFPSHPQMAQHKASSPTQQNSSQQDLFSRLIQETQQSRVNMMASYQILQQVKKMSAQNYPEQQQQFQCQASSNQGITSNYLQQKLSEAYGTDLQQNKPQSYQQAPKQPQDSTEAQQRINFIRQLMQKKLQSSPVRTSDDSSYLNKRTLSQQISQVAGQHREDSIEEDRSSTGQTQVSDAPKQVSASNKYLSLPHPINRRISYSNWEEESIESVGFNQMLENIEFLLEQKVDDKERVLVLLKKTKWNKKRLIENIKKNKAYYRDFFDGISGRNIVKKFKNKEENQF